jgi:hypothetical protein
VYKKLAEACCDADPNKRPKDRTKINGEIRDLVKKIEEDKSDDSVWNTIYYNDIKPLSRLEKESK